MSNSVPSQLQKLQEQYRKSLPDKAQLLRELWDRLRFLDWSTEDLTMLATLAHRLAGSGGAYGFPGVSEHARSLDEYLRGAVDSGYPEEVRACIDAGVARLYREMIDSATPAAMALSEPPSAAGAGRVAIIDDDEDLRDLLCVHLETAGYEVQTFDSPQQALGSDEDWSADAIILDIHFSVGDLAGIEAIGALRQRAGDRLPVILISARTDITARLRGLRAGCTAYLSKPLDFDSLLAELASAIATQRFRLRALLIDDDLEVAEAQAAMLEQAGVETRTLQDPLQALRHIEQFHPDVIVLDRQMQRCSGDELASLLADTPGCETLPLVFVSADASEAARERAMGLGALAYLTKPVQAESLLQAVRRAVRTNRRRMARVRGITRQQHGSSALPRQHLLDSMELILADDAAAPELNTLLLLGLDQIELIHGHYGAAAVWAMQDQLTALIGDLMPPHCQWSVLGDTVICILCDSRQEPSPEALAESIRSKIERLPFNHGSHRLRTTASIALVARQPGHRSARSWLSDAEHAEASLQQQGGNRIQNVVSAQRTEASSIALSDRLPVEQMALSLQPGVDIEGHEPTVYWCELSWRAADNEWLSSAALRADLQHRGMLDSADRWVVEAAVAALRAEHPRPGRREFVLTPMQRLPELEPLLAHFHDQLAKAPLPADTELHLEVGEEWLRLHHQQTASAAKQLARLGCALSLFGYGSTEATIDPRVLKRFKRVRLCRSLVGQAKDQSAAQARLRDLIQKALAADCEVVAGGVDDARTLSLLWQTGARLFRGSFVVGLESHTLLPAPMLFKAQDSPSAATSETPSPL